MATLSAWPWNNLGAYKYMLYGPFLANVVYSRIQQGSIQWESWCLHLLIICALRCEVYNRFTCFSNMLFLTRNRRINQKGVDFKLVDKEWDWDNFIILQALIGSMACYILPCVTNLPIWNTKGIIIATLLHVLISEPVYYWVHRWFLHGNYFFTNYHSFHHSSSVIQPTTAGSATFLEHLFLSAVIAIPLIGTCLAGFGSLGMIYGYLMIFDFLRGLGHCNFEFLPRQLFQAFPFFRYIVYTPTYHSLHHTDMGTNYCLFMPLFDALGNTLNSKSWDLHRKISMDAGINKVVPDFVFLAHAVDLSTSIHQPYIFRSCASVPYKFALYQIPYLPVAFVAMLLMWAKSKTYLSAFYNLRGRLHQMWVVPRYGFQYFLPFALDGINKQIENAILRADKMGVKVISLAALNKNEALNGGGTLFVNKHPNLRVRVVHGNTLTAAVIINELPKGVEEVFLTGATSKLGRAIALYLCRRKVRVLMLTLSTERFQKIQKEAPVEYQKYIVQVTKYQAAKNCKTWIVGKWITPREQSWAPSGAHFHQFVVPPILHFRRDCTYGDLAAIRLPEDVEGLGYCEYKLDRGVVHACHAGGVVHFLEGWTHNEVGAIDVDRIDVVWEAAMKHGLKPVSSLPNKH